ncbi:hypothetical protein C8R43DRAFT_1022253 [Mycena crocata]|nr:hypothetical protein C8R43DRAFT_1022253 [Mycena crocata]
MDRTPHDALSVFWGCLHGLLCFAISLFLCMHVHSPMVIVHYVVMFVSASTSLTTQPTSIHV